MLKRTRPSIVACARRRAPACGGGHLRNVVREQYEGSTFPRQDRAAVGMQAWSHR